MGSPLSSTALSQFLKQQFYTMLIIALFCEISLKSISKEFFLAATAGLYIWIGYPSIHVYSHGMNFISLYLVEAGRKKFKFYVSFSFSFCLFLFCHRICSLERHQGVRIRFTSDIYKGVDFWSLVSAAVAC